MHGEMIFSVTILSMWQGHYQTSFLLTSFDYQALAEAYPVAKEGGGRTMHSYWLLLSCGLLALAGADKFKLCLSSEPAGNQCLGVEQGSEASGGFSG